MEELLNRLRVRGDYDASSFQEGLVLLLDKPYNWTSFDVVGKVRILLREHLGIKKIKVGHAGTLDPLATGLLVVCTGKATRLVEQFMGLPKEYVSTITFGGTTPSFDLETEVLETFDAANITQLDIETALTRFAGKQLQVPPSFSAIKVKGKRAYEHARNGKEIGMAPREVEFYELELLGFHHPVARVRVVCSKGTYIRSFANDLGKVLNTGAYLSALRRTAIGPLVLEQTISLEHFGELLKKIQRAEYQTAPVETIFTGIFNPSGDS